MIRILKPLVIFGSICVMVDLLIIYDLKISEILISILGFIPTGWFLLQVSEIHYLLTCLSLNIKLWPAHERTNS